MTTVAESPSAELVGVETDESGQALRLVKREGLQASNQGVVRFSECPLCDDDGRHRREVRFRAKFGEVGKSGLGTFAEIQHHGLDGRSLRNGRRLFHRCRFHSLVPVFPEELTHEMTYVSVLVEDEDRGADRRLRAGTHGNHWRVSNRHPGVHISRQFDTEV